VAQGHRFRNSEYSEVTRNDLMVRIERLEMKGYIAQQAFGHPTRLAFIRYTGALFAVAVGVLLASWLQSVLDPSVVLLVAILAAAWFSGFWPALLASILATLALDYFFTPPIYTLTQRSRIFLASSSSPLAKIDPTSAREK
jgi:K+-sensing histidine kinase KdpD